MSYSFDRLFAQTSLVGKLCWYKKPYKQDMTFSRIKEVDTKVTDRGKTIYLLLNNGVTAVLHNHECPDYIGEDKVWGFLSQEECNKYWDM